MNRLAVSGIKVMVTGLVLGTSLVAARPGVSDEQPPAPQLTLLPVPWPPAQAVGFGGQETPPPPAPAFPSEPGRGPEQVPSTNPLPLDPARTPIQGRTVQPETPATGTRAGGAATGAPNPPRGPADSRPQDIQFDRNGLVTLHTNELDVRQLLELLSRRSGMNILVSPKVSGSITANFEKVTLQELLRSVLKLADLVEKVEGGIHYIYSREEIKDVAETAKKERIITKVYRLNYIRADELMVMLAPFLSDDVGKKRFSTSANYQFGISEASTLSTGGIGGGAAGGVGGGGGGGGGGGAVGGAGTIQRGTQPPTGGMSVSSNDILVIQDYESNLKIIDQIIQRVDVQPLQVLIEAVIISVELDKEKQLGVNFAVVDNLGQQLATIGQGSVLNGNVGFTPASVLTAAGKIAAGATPDPNGFASATDGIKYGFISNNITGFIRALETVGSTKILASPRILVLNKQRAEIQLGSRLGFQTLSQNFTSTIQQVQFLNVGTLLRIRPFISSDGMVRMEIHPERSQGAVVNNLPSAATAELTTNVMVPNGATLVIGGLMEDQDQYSAQGLPGLTRWPVLGHLFGFKDKIDQRRELVVLLTPRIWTTNNAAACRDEPSQGAGASIKENNRPAFAMASNRTVTPSRTAANRTAPGGTAAPSAAVAPGTTATPGASAVPAAIPGAAAASGAAATPANREPVVPASPPSLHEALPLQPSSPLPPFSALDPNARSTEPSRFQRVVPLTVTDGNVTPDRFQMQGGEKLDSDRSTAIADTLESVESTRSDDAGNPPRPSGEPRPIPPTRQNPKVVSMVSRASFETVRPAPPAERAVTVGSPADVRKHLVRSGEDFSSIARHYYGSANLAGALWWANRGIVAWPGALAAGMRINIPPPERLQPGLGAMGAGSQAILDTGSISWNPSNPPETRQTGQEGKTIPSPPGRKCRAAADEEVYRQNETDVGGCAIHVVKPSETLESIARDRLGDPHRAREIAELNQDLLSDTNGLKLGMRLLLPELSDASSSR